MNEKDRIHIITRDCIPIFALRTWGAADMYMQSHSSHQQQGEWKGDTTQMFRVNFVRRDWGRNPAFGGDGGASDWKGDIPDKVWVMVGRAGYKSEEYGKPIKAAPTDWRLKNWLKYCRGISGEQRDGLHNHQIYEVPVYDEKPDENIYNPYDI